MGRGEPAAEDVFCSIGIEPVTLELGGVCGVAVEAAFMSWPESPSLTIPDT